MLVVGGEQPAGVGVAGPFGENLLGPPGPFLVVGVVKHPPCDFELALPVVGRGNQPCPRGVEMLEFFAQPACRGLLRAASSARPTREGEAAGMPHRHVVRIHGDRTVEKGQRGRPVTASRGRGGQFVQGFRVPGVQGQRTVQVSSGGLFVAVFHQVPAGPELCGSVIGTRGQILLVLDRGLGIAMGLAQLFGQTEPGAGQ